MNNVKRILLLMILLLLMSAPGYACMMDIDAQAKEIFGPATISLHNDMTYGNTDAITLFAFNLYEPGLNYDLQFDPTGNGNWTNFDPLFGPSPQSSLGLSSYTFSQTGTFDLDLRLFDGDGVVSQTAALSFHDPQIQSKEQDWFSWAQLEWFDKDGQALDVTTALWAWAPWDSKDLVGPEAVPIPGTGLLLMIGVVGLIGCRRNVRSRLTRR